MTLGSTKPPPSLHADSQQGRVSARERLALNVIRFRKALTWSQEDLALRAGLHRTFVAHVERQARNISLDNIEKIADALGVSIDQLLCEPQTIENR